MVSRLIFCALLVAAVAATPRAASAQAAITPPAAQAVAPPAPQRAFPPPLTIPGKPIESRPPERAGDVPFFPEQTRAPYVKTAHYETTVITDKLKNPWSVAFLSGGRFLVTEREPDAAVRIVSPDGGVSAPLAGLENLATQGKLGLLEIALDPKFARNKRVFFTFFERLEKQYSNTMIARATLDEDALALKDIKVIFRAHPFAPIENFSNKQGGRIVFGKDGSLFVDIGDRDRDEPWLVAQQLDNHLGKIVHIDADGAPARDNPFIGKAGALPEIWAYGFRAPIGLAFDPKTGKLWQTEHGPRGGDELNLIVKGANYGWPVVTRGINYDGKFVGQGLLEKEGTVQPVYYWDPVIGPSGLAFYDGKLFPEWKGSMLVGALRGKMISRLRLKNGKVVEEEALLVEQNARIRDVRVGPEGAVYVLAEPNKLLRMTPTKK